MPTMFTPPACSHPRSRQPVPSASCFSTGDEQHPVYSHPVLQRVTRQPALSGRDPRTSRALTVTRSQGLQTPSTGVAGTITDPVNRSLRLPIGPHKGRGHIPVIRPCLHHPQSTKVRTQSTGRLICHLSPHSTSPTPLSTGVVDARPRWTVSTLGSPPAIHTPITAAYLPLPAAL
jgi:hypothetical protein